MRRFFFRGLLLLPVVGVLSAVGGPPAAADTGIQYTNLACSDGTSLDLGLDPASISALTSAVSAINFNPAGLACGLSDTNSPAGGGNPQRDFAVGGGQLVADCAPYGGTGLIHYSFGLSAHSDADSQTRGVGGTFNVDVPVQGGTCPVYGHTVAKIDCLAVSGNHADMTAVITKSTGPYLGPGYVGAEEQISVTDNGSLPDTIDAFVTTGPCQFEQPFEQPIARGNIDVHDAAP